MKQRNWKRRCAMLTAGTITMGMLSQTAVFADSEGGTFDIAAFEQEHSENPVTISMYPMNANVTSGTVSGYLGDFFASQGLAIDIWAYSDEKTNAILASGDLPDIMHVTAENLETMIDAGMVLELDDYLDDLPHVQAAIADNGLEPALNFVREYRSNDTGKLYAMPTGVGGGDYYDTADRNAVKLNWKVYEQIGAPEINNYDDLIEVAKQMMEAYPTDEETGSKTWGTVLNSGSDTEYWGNIITWMRWHGYSETQLPYLIEQDMINGTCQSILDENSLYYQGLKFYFDCMQAGVLDPDSINTDRSAAGKKTKMFGAGTTPGWRSTFYEYWIPGTQYYLNGNSVFGSADDYLVINADTKNLDACLKFIDMMADPDAQLWGNAGPEGDMYQIDDNVLTLTQKAKDYNSTSSGEGYFYDNGEQAYLWNTAWILSSGAKTTYVDGDGNSVMAVHTGWLEEKKITSDNEAYRVWKKTTGYDSWQDLIEKNNVLVSESKYDYITNFLSTPDESMKLTMSTIKDKVVDASWKMVYAENEDEFNSIWEKLVEDCKDLGADDLMQWRLDDIDQAIEKRDEVMK